MTEKDVMAKLEEVIDPELNISIVDLGLVYEVKIKKNSSVLIKMTLTTIGCPLFPVIEKDIKEKLSEIGFKDIKIDLVFDPPWSIEKMTERGKAVLGI